MTHARLLDTGPHPRRVDAMEPLDNCHRETIRMLREFDALIDRVATLGIDPQARASAATIDRYFSEDLRQHHLDEESNVFPVLEGSADPDTLQAIALLKQDHAWLRTDWRMLSPLVRAIASGLDWPDPDTLRDGVGVFTKLAHDHIALEESLIYPQARILMLEASQRRMRRAMAMRR
jgi:hemerythrin-like domain-containing protein